MKNKELKEKFTKTDIKDKPPIMGFIQGEQYQETGLQEILNVLLEGDTNLDLKTHVIRPKQLSSLFTFANVLKVCNYPKSSQLLHNFIEQYLRYMISYKRLSRGEIIKALTTVVQENENAEGFKKLITEMK